MIKKLQRKITILVICVLVLVSAGIVYSINTVNWNHLEAQAESVLDTLAENRGLRPDSETDKKEEFILPDDLDSTVVLDSVKQTNLENTADPEASADASGEISETPAAQETPETPETPETSETPEVTEPTTAAENTDPGEAVPSEEPETEPETGTNEDPDEDPDDIESEVTEEITVPGQMSGEEESSAETPTEEKETQKADPEKKPVKKQAAETEEPVNTQQEPYYTNDYHYYSDIQTEETADPAVSAPAAETKPEAVPASAGQPEDTEDSAASLSNYYVIYLSEENGIQDWTSDRPELYSDRQVAELTELALASGQTSGRIGSQFYKLTTQDGQKMLIVLDARIDVANARSVLRTTIIIAALACILLSIAASLLIRRMLIPVEVAFKKQKQFVWDASHELKTPLAVISANADVLEMEYGENEYLGYIQSEVKRTNLLVKDLLTLARMDQGTLTADIKRMNLRDAVLSVALPFECKAFEDEKEFLIETPEEDVFCQGDEAMLKQLTVILLSNAFKYSNERGKISVEVSKRGTGAELQVRNTGNGISEEDREKIFDRFYRADPAHNRNIEGFGFGLSIAKTIVDKHKGRIKVNSSPDGETTFSVFIPGTSRQPLVHG